MSILERLEERCLLASGPVAVRDAYLANALETLSVPATEGVLVNDLYDGAGSLVAVLQDAPLHGDVLLQPDGSFTYQTYGNYGGVDRFSYHALAGANVSNRVSVQIELTAQPNLPVAVHDTFRVAEDGVLVADKTPLFSVQKFAVDAEQLVYDSSGRRIYALVDQAVVPIDPATGQVGTAITIGDGAESIVISDDGNYIFAVTNSRRSVRRLNTQTGEVDLEFVVGDFSEFGLAVGELEAVPGKPTAVAVAQYYPCCSPRQGGIAVFDEGVRLPKHTNNGLGSSGGGDSIAFADEGVLVGYTSSISSFDLTIMNVDSSGVTVKQSGVAAYSGNLSILAGGGYVYSDQGVIYSLAAGRTIGRLPVSGSILPDPANDRVFVLHGDGPTTTLSWYNPATRARLGRVAIPGISGQGTDLVHYGDGGVAFRTSNNEVIVVQSDQISGVTRQGVLTNDADPEGDPLTAELVTSVSHGALVWNGDGTFQYTPSPDYFGLDQFSYRVSDGSHTSNVGLVTIEVEPVNDAPVARVDRYNATEDQSLSIGVAQGVLANDSDIDSSALTAVLVAEPLHGTILLRSDGSFVYTPDPDFSGMDQFSYRADDGGRQSSETTVTIDVTELGELPVPTPDQYTMNEDGVLLLDGSPQLSLTTVNQPAGGMVFAQNSEQLWVSVPSDSSSFANSLLQVDPYTGARGNAVAIGTDPREIVISSDQRYLYTVVQDQRGVRAYDLQTGQAGDTFYMPGTGEFAERVRTIHPIPGRADRVLISRYYRGFSPPAGGTWVYTKDGDILPQHFGEGLGTGGADITTVDQTGTKAYGYQNSISSFDFWLMTIDDQGVHESGSYSWGSMLSGFNVGRIATVNGLLLTDRGEIIDLTSRELLARFDGGENFFIDAARNRLFSIDSDSNSAALCVYDLETLKLVDRVDLPGISGSTSNLVRFGVDGVAFRTRPSQGEGELILVQTSAVAGVVPHGVFDNDRDTSTTAQAFLVSDVSHGRLTLNTDGSFVYRPNAEYSGTDQFSYRIVDGAYQSEAVNVSIVIRPVNDAPVATVDSYTLVEDSTLTVAVANGVLRNDSDPEAQPMTAAIATPPAHGTLQFNANGSFTYKPSLDYFGEDSFKYTVTDGDRTSTPTTVSLLVTPTPDPTVATSDQYVLNQGTALNADSPVLVTTEPTRVQLVSEGSLWLYVDNGSDQGVAWRAADFDDSSWQSGRAPLGYGDGDEATVVGYGPDANNKYVTTYFRRAFNVEQVAGLEQLAVELKRDDGAVVYLNGVEIARSNLPANPDFDTFATSSASDDGSRFLHFDVDSALLQEGRNVLAVEIHQSARNSSDISFELQLLATRLPENRIAGVLANDSDADGLPLSATVLQGPEHGTLTMNPNGTFVYTPDVRFFGTDQFRYSAGDGVGANAAATVTFQVVQANVRPFANDDQYLLTPRTTLSVSREQGLLVNDEDLELAPLTVQVVSPPEHGTVNLAADGSFSYTPGESFRLVDQFTYVANDGQLVSERATVTIRANVPTIDVGHHQLQPNTPNQKVVLQVTGGQLVSGLNLFAMSGDGGPELTQLGLPPGTDGPAITGIELKQGGIFASVPDIPSVDLSVPQVAYATIAIQQPGGTVAAEGQLATLTVDTTGLFGGTFELRLDQVLPQLDGGPFHTNFVNYPIEIIAGSLQIVSAEIVGRHVFYNNSVFDGQDSGITAADDLTIAPDKTALLPGQTASFANDTNYSRGLNGIVIDVDNLLGAPTLDDFRFRIGNSDDTSRWTAAPAPAEFELHAGRGADGSDRLFITWPDRAILNRWLEVTMRSTARTGLEADERFYFGNAVGETGNDRQNALVNASDVIGARDHPRGPFNLAAIDDPFDFNRDRLVTATDVILARDHVTSPLTALRLITPTVALAPPTAANAVSPPVAKPIAWPNPANGTDPAPDGIGAAVLGPIARQVTRKTIEDPKKTDRQETPPRRVLVDRERVVDRQDRRQSRQRIHAIDEVWGQSTQWLEKDALLEALFQEQDRGAFVA